MKYLKHKKYELFKKYVAKNSKRIKNDFEY